MTTTLQIRLDSKMKTAAQRTFKSMGLDMSSGVKLYLSQVINKKEIPFPVMSVDYWPREMKLKLIKEEEYAFKHGKRYANAKELHDDILKNG